MKKTLSLLLCLILMLSSLSVFAADNVTMYGQDGKSVSVSADEVDAYRAKGYRTTPPLVQKISSLPKTFTEKSFYSTKSETITKFEYLRSEYNSGNTQLKIFYKAEADGDMVSYNMNCYDSNGSLLKSVYFSTPTLSNYEKFELVPLETAYFKIVSRDENCTTEFVYKNQMYVYSSDGTKKVIYDIQLPVYLNKGYFASYPEKVYSADGTTSKIIGSDELKQYLTDGWVSKTSILIYSPNGKTSVVKKSQVDDYIAVGWYKFPVTKVYSADGRSVVIATSQVESYKSVGWYSSPEEAKMATTDYTYFAGNDFRRIKNKYSSATPRGAYVGKYINKEGDICVITIVFYTITNDYHEVTLHNVTDGTYISDPANYYNRLADDYWGANKLYFLDMATEVLEQQVVALKSGTFVSASKLGK